MNKKILIIEDQPDLLETLCELLEFEGYQVRSAANGRAGLKLLSQGELPSVIVLDLKNPESGAARFLIDKANDVRYAGIPVISLSDLHPDEKALYLEEAIKLKVTANLSKPINLEVFLNSIDQISNPPA